MVYVERIRFIGVCASVQRNDYKFYGRCMAVANDKVMVHCFNFSTQTQQHACSDLMIL